MDPELRAVLAEQWVQLEEVRRLSSYLKRSHFLLQREFGLARRELWASRPQTCLAAKRQPAGALAPLLEPGPAAALAAMAGARGAGRLAAAARPCADALAGTLLSCAAAAEGSGGWVCEDHGEVHACEGWTLTLHGAAGGAVEGGCQAAAGLDEARMQERWLEHLGRGPEEALARSWAALEASRRPGQSLRASRLDSPQAWVSCTEAFCDCRTDSSNELHSDFEELEGGFELEEIEIPEDRLLWSAGKDSLWNESYESMMAVELSDEFEIEDAVARGGAVGAGEGVEVLDLCFGEEGSWGLEDDASAQASEASEAESCEEPEALGPWEVGGAREAPGAKEADETCKSQTAQVAPEVSRPTIQVEEAASREEAASPEKEKLEKNSREPGQDSSRAGPDDVVKALTALAQAGFPMTSCAACGSRERLVRHPVGKYCKDWDHRIYCTRCWEFWNASLYLGGQGGVRGPFAVRSEALMPVWRTAALGSPQTGGIRRLTRSGPQIVAE